VCVYILFFAVSNIANDYTMLGSSQVLFSQFHSPISYHSQYSPCILLRAWIQIWYLKIALVEYSKLLNVVGPLVWFSLAYIPSLVSSFSYIILYIYIYTRNAWVLPTICNIRIYIVYIPVFVGWFRVLAISLRPSAAPQRSPAAPKSVRAARPAEEPESAAANEQFARRLLKIAETTKTN